MLHGAVDPGVGVTMRVFPWAQVPTPNPTPRNPGPEPNGLSIPPPNATASPHLTTKATREVAR